MQITLARALKIKNILAGKVQKLQNRLTSENSVSEGKSRSDVREVQYKLAEAVRHLVDLKLKINTANTNIQQLIYMIAENKSALTFWGGVSTLDGDSGQVHYGTSVKEIYNAVIKEPEKEKIIADLEGEIESQQERIDQHNFNTFVEVNEQLLASAGVKR